MLQIRGNRLVQPWVARTYQARLGVPRCALDQLGDEVGHRRRLRRVLQLMFRLGQISREVFDAALFEPDAPFRHIEVVEHGGRRKLAKQALRGFVGIRRQGRDIRRARLPASSWSLRA